MGFKSSSSSSVALFLTVNLMFFTFASACGTCTMPSTPTPKPKYSTPKVPKPNPSSPTSTPAHSKVSCPRDTLKLGVCASLLGGPLSIVIGNPPNYPCCTLLNGLADLEAAVCLCTAIRANVLGLHLNVDLSLSLLLNTCGKKLPADFICA